MVCLPALMRSGSTSSSKGNALQRHVHSRRNVIGHERGNTDAEIDVKTVLQFFRRARGHFIASPRHYAAPLGRVVRNSICFSYGAPQIKRFT
jgi:hypothetical protein